MKKLILLAVAGVALALSASAEAQAGGRHGWGGFRTSGGVHGTYYGPRYYGPGLSGYSRYSPGLYGYRSHATPGYGYRGYGYRDYGYRHDDCDRGDYGSPQLNIFFGDGDSGFGDHRFRY
jgi:hypothetical protein